MRLTQMVMLSGKLRGEVNWEGLLFTEPLQLKANEMMGEHHSGNPVLHHSVIQFWTFGFMSDQKKRYLDPTSFLVPSMHSSSYMQVHWYLLPLFSSWPRFLISWRAMQLKTELYTVQWPWSLAIMHNVITKCCDAVTTLWSKKRGLCHSSDPLWRTLFLALLNAGGTAGDEEVAELHVGGKGGSR